MATKNITSDVSGNSPSVKGDYAVGNKRPPKDKQFGQPNGNKPGRNGGWRKEDTPRYKLEQLMKLPEESIVELANSKDAPLFERRLARSLLKENEWKVTESMVNQVYGTPKQTSETDITSGGEKITGLQIAFGKFGKDEKD